MKTKKALWVTPSAKLAEEDIPNEFDTWKAKVYKKKTETSTYHSLHKYTGEYDIIILDEVQHITLNNAVNLLSGKLKAKSIVVLTGTVPKDKEKLEILRKLNLKVIERITIDEAVEKDIIADYTINVVEVPLNMKDKNIEAGKKGSKFMQTEFDNYQYKNKMVNQFMFSSNPKHKATLKFMILNRRRAIMNSPSKHDVAKKLFNSLGKRVLMFASSIKQAEELSTYTYHSKTDNGDMDKFTDGKIDKLACVNAGGTGFTYTNVDHFIIVQSDSNNNGSITQKLARSLLKQGNYKATIWIICLLNTKDVDWVEKALQDYDKSKINYVSVKNI